MKALSQFLISFVLIILAFTIYGILKENGDLNAGSMYGLVAIMPASIIVCICLIFYFLADQFTKAGNRNYLKQIAHLLLIAILPFLNLNGFKFLILTLAIVIISIVNLFAFAISKKSTN